MHCEHVPQNPQERRLRVTVIHLQFGAVDGQLHRVKVLWQCGEVASPDFGDCAAQGQAPLLMADVEPAAAAELEVH